MSLRVNLALGDRGSFAARVLALSSLVALVAGSLALRGAVLAAAPTGAAGGGALLVSVFLAEVDSLLSAWLVPVWLLMAAAAFAVSLDSARSFEGTARLVSEVGGTGQSRSLVLVRGAILSALSFALGLSLGLVASQVVFRVFAVAVGAQYYVPELSPLSLGAVAALSLSALLAGTLAASLRRRGP
ncbi:MAG: hypothetical protein JRN21_04800 [Nitrososphaerota archaeon]|nr:hypothetical protein [Nitrososphaerota archaeon]